MRGRAPAPQLLIIEDNVSIATLVGEAFEEEGYRIAGYAKSVEQSLEMIKRCKFDLALLDAHLKESHSGPAAVELRKRNIPFILMTGSKDMVSSAHAGAPIILKPFKMSELLEAVGRLCARH